MSNVKGVVLSDRDLDSIALYDQGDAARVLHLSPKTLEKKRHTGDGPPFVKIGKLVRYRRCDLLAFLNEHVRTSTSDRNK